MRFIKKYFYLFVIILILVGCFCFIFIKINLISKRHIITENDDILTSKNSEIENKEIVKEIVQVDIKGAIKNPGVYKVDAESVINDVIKLAGGLTKDADTSLTNLSKKVINEMVIIIYTKEEVKKSNVVDTVVKVVEKKCVCPNIQNDGCINDKIDSTITNKETLVNINLATLDELTSLPGVGESKAKAIIEYRENNKFVNIEDILNVSGIGNALFEQIKIYITT